MAIIDEQNFIVTEQFGKSGETGELKVWRSSTTGF